MQPHRSRQKARRRLSPLQILVHATAWIPLAVLAAAFLTDNLTVNPIQAAEIRTGDIAIIYLALSLACTPLNTLLRLPDLNKIRRPLGLYAYLYASIHLLVFLGLDYTFDPGLIVQAIGEKPYILVGLAAFIVLTALAATSFRRSQARMGKTWKRLHQLVYAANLLVVIHFSLSVKGNLFRLQGDVFRPLLALTIVALLLAARIPSIRRWIAEHRPRLQFGRGS